MARDYKDAGAERSSELLRTLLGAATTIGTQKMKNDNELAQLDQKQKIAASNLETLLGKAKAGEIPAGAGVSMDGAAITRPATIGLTPEAAERQKVREEALGLRATKLVSDDYNKIVGKSPTRVQAGQAILAALSSNDTTTAGRIKVQLPLLEGENNKPTDKERELMLQVTGETMGAKLKNFLGMSSPTISEAQKNDLDKYVRARMREEQGIIDRGRGEVLTRYGHITKGLSAIDQAELEKSLGMSSGELLGKVQEHPALPKQGIMDNLKTGLPGTSSLTPRQKRIQELKAKRGG